MDNNELAESINSIEQLGGGQSHFNKLIILVLVLAIVYFVYNLFFSSNKTKKNKSTKPGNDLLDIIRKKNIKILTASWCGYCNKLKKDLETLGNPDDIIVVYDKLSESQKKKWTVEIDGFPTMVRNRNKVVAVGYAPIDVLHKKISAV